MQTLKNCKTDGRVDYVKAQELLPNRTMKALEVMASRLNHKERIVPDMRRERMRYIAKKAQYFCRTYNDNWEKAFGRASVEWQNLQTQKRVGTTSTGQPITQARAVEVPQVPVSAPSLPANPHP